MLQKHSSSGVLKNMAEFLEKHLWKSHFYNKIAGWDSTIL